MIFSEETAAIRPPPAGGGGPKGDRDRRPREQYRVNHRIRVPEVRVVLDDGTQLGILTRDEALRLAEEKGLDLVEIAARSNPPVCRIMDYGRFKYEQSKKQKQARKHAASMELKEIKFRPKTEQHDMDFKIKHVRRFLEEGNKCRLVIVFRGREITHPETGVAVLNRVVEATTDIASVEVRPSLEGKRMLMILGPKAGVVRRAKAPSAPVAAGAGPAVAAPPGQGAQAPNPPPERAD
ncbi:MAG TPA: translation initiation factor IF-3 [Kofleriaceae bacterium]|nr:translation initiation factor IF-3 [Kofleriaceae bacterium]